MEALECGAAALGIVLAYYGLRVPLERLRVECGVSRDGGKASNLLRAARQFGLVAKGFKCEPTALRGVDPPLIAHWNFNHFVVVEGFVGNRAHINDPATGPRTVSDQEFDQAFTGIALVFQPSEEFEPGGATPKLLPALARRLAGFEGALLFVVLTGVALVIPSLIAPVFTKIFVDQILLFEYDSWMRPLLVAIGLTATLFGLLTWFQQQFLLRFETGLAVSRSAEFFWHVLRMPVDFFAQRMTGDIASRVAVNDRIASLLSRDLATHGLGLLMVGFYALLMGLYDFQLMIVSVVIVLGNFVALRAVARRRIDISRQLLQEEGKLAGISLSGLQSIEMLKAQAGESDLFTKWSGYQAKVVNLRQQLGRYTHALAAVPPLLSAMVTAILLGFGSLRVIDGGMTLGGLVAFQALMLAFARPVEGLAGLGGKLQTIEGDMARLEDVLRYPRDPQIPDVSVSIEDSVTEESKNSKYGKEHVDPHTLSKLGGRVEVRALTFGYSRFAQPVLEEIDLVIRPGSRVALVGISGSGKSTLGRLVSGLFDPWEGEILFDGLSRTEIPRSVLNASIATVDQSIFLFEGTLRENLTLWDATIPHPVLVQAARDAQIHDEIVTRQEGYDTWVAEGGANWSGGQRQRLELARALALEPAVLVLDEATSALDPETEKLIDEALRRRGCTCLIIAHRLSTIRDADEIIVLEEGRIVERGRHQELLEAAGRYAEMIHLY